MVETAALRVSKAAQCLARFWKRKTDEYDREEQIYEKALRSDNLDDESFEEVTGLLREARTERAKDLAGWKRCSERAVVRDALEIL